MAASPELKGARVIVTGGNKGIGREIVRGLVQRGAHVTIAARDLAACQVVKAELEAEEAGAAAAVTAGGRCLCAQLDLQDPASIRRFAAEQRKDSQPIRLLVNNAGVMGVGYQSPPAPAQQPASATPTQHQSLQQQQQQQAEVMDSHILVNHLGPFLLTQLLSDGLQSGSRVVNIASRAHRAGSLAFDPATGRLVQKPNVSWFKRYGDSKLANVLFTAELQRRWGPKGVVCVSVSPGLVSTTLFNSLPWPLNLLSSAFMPLVAQTPIQGARTAIWACTSPEVTGAPEQLFLHNCKPQEPQVAARDANLAKQLWDWSEAFWAAR